jgi:hypothetical protein
VGKHFDEVSKGQSLKNFSLFDDNIVTIQNKLNIHLKVYNFNWFHKSELGQSLKKLDLKQVDITWFMSPRLELEDPN